MSRSRKKNAIYKIGDPSNKKLFNRKLRRTTDIYDIPNGKAYKKMNQSWDITDWKIDCNWESLKDDYIEMFGDEETAWSEWKRHAGTK